jgi:hypothetical protein
VVRVLHLGPYALRRIYSVIASGHGDGQNRLAGRAGIESLAVDTLKGNVAANHHQTTAAKDIVVDGIQAVEKCFGPDKSIWVQQQRVGADVGDDNTIERW